MILRTPLTILAFLTFLTCNTFAQRQSAQDSTDQQINDFSLAGFGERGRKTWDISAKSADISADNIILNDVVSNIYGEKENVKLTASRGNITTGANDARTKSNLNRVTLEKDVTMEINSVAPEDKLAAVDKNKTIITCDGSLVIDYEKNIATFNNNVKIDRQDLQIYSDAMDIYFAKSDKPDKEMLTKSTAPPLLNSKIDRIIARGNVKIIRGENVSYSDEAIYTALDRKITLKGRPKLVIYSTEDISAPSGN